MSTVDDKKIHSQLAFIHQILTQRTQYLIEEFEIAKDAAITITNMANQLADKIQAAEKELQLKTPEEIPTSAENPASTPNE